MIELQVIKVVSLKSEVHLRFSGEKFKNLKDTLNQIFLEIKYNKGEKNTILFSPAGASFDNFKNFEDRGFYFNQTIKKYLNAN